MLVGSATPTLLLVGGPAWGHVGKTEPGLSVWSTWTFAPEIVTAALLVVLVYVTGIFRRRTSEGRAGLWRHGVFALGIASLLLALVSPIDFMAEHLFSMHQIQHLLLRMIGPMLIAFAAPQAMLISGLPSSIRRKVLAPLLASRALRPAFVTLANPVVVTALFIAALYVWQFRRFHDAALLNEPIHYLMHVTMLAAGLLFWWRIFDRRPPPIGLFYGTRLMMLWIVILSNIGLGAYTTLKSELLYPAYDIVGRLFDVQPLTDEMVGGFIIWVPSSMMCLVAVIVVIHMLGGHETRLAEIGMNWSPSNSVALLYPTTGEALIENARSKNRTMAVSFTMFAIAVFSAVIFVGVLNHLNNTASHGPSARLSSAPGQSTE